MKTKKPSFWLTVALLITCACAAFALVGCGESAPAPHEHNYTAWRYNDAEHWRECEADGATTEKSKHKFENGRCECGLQDTRTFGTVTGKITQHGGKTPDDFDSVTVDFGGDDVNVSIDEQGVFTATHVTVGKDYDVTVSREGYSTYTALVQVGAENETVTLEKPFALEYSRFDFWLGWDGAQHDITHVNDENPVIGNDGKTLNVITRDAYNDVAVSLWMKDGNSTHVQGIQGIFFKFDDGKYMFARCEKMSNGTYKLQWAMNFNGTGKWSVNTVMSVVESWNDFQNPLNADQKAKFEGADGLKVTLLRRGGTLYTFVDDEWIAGGTMTLPAEYADDNVKVGFYDYDSKEKATWKFDIEENVAAYEEQLTEYDAPEVSAANGEITFDKAAYKHGERAVITITPDDGYILGTLTVNGKSVGAETENGTYSFAVNSEITVQADFIPSANFESVTFSTPAEANADGLKITLYRDDQDDIVGTVANNEFTAADVKPGVWHAKTTQYGIEVALKDVYVGTDTVALDMSGVFESATAVNFDNAKTYSGGGDIFYAVPADISGDAYFAMKWKSPTDTANIADDKARFGLRLFYEGNKEYSVTFVVKSGKWKIQENNSWKEATVADSYLSELKTNGIYMALFREGASGKVHVYLGTSKENLVEAAVLDSATEFKSKSIVSFGAGFWNGNYNATISDLKYGKTMAEAFGIDYALQNVTLTVNGHNAGETLPLGGQVTLTSAMDSTVHTVTLGANGSVTVENLVTPAVYKVTLNGEDYNYGQITLEKGATAATVSLEYKRFNLWTGWDGAQHDMSKVNEVNPTIGNDGKTLNVISRDNYDDVAVSLWFKSGNSTHQNGNNSGEQGIFIKYADGKYMFLRLLRNENDNNKHRLQWAPNFDGNGKWNDFVGLNSAIAHGWTEFGNGTYENELNSADGLKVTLVRKGNMIYAMVNDVTISQMTMALPVDYADDKVQFGFFAYNSKANATWKFDVAAPSGAYGSEIYQDHNNAEHVNSVKLSGESVSFVAKFRIAATNEQDKRVSIDMKLEKCDKWTAMGFCTKTDGSVKFQTINMWEVNGASLPEYDELSSDENAALRGESGLYLAITVNTATGKVTAYIGTDKQQLRQISTQTNEVYKDAIVRTGVRMAGGISSSAAEFAYGASLEKIGCAVVTA